MIEVFHRGANAQMNESDLFGPFDGGYEDDNEIAQFYEGYLCRCHFEVVKKSLRLHLKKGLSTLLEAGKFI